ncbi:MAG: hypothetical protein JXX14_22330 [Deltaproteobacteria bacterium]|nr:hypothetical protein [Deltaproteobacteria bacterium]
MASRNMTEQVKIGLAVGAIALTFLAYIISRLKVNAQKNAAAREFLEKTPVIRLGRYSLNAFQSFVAALIIAACFGTINYNRYSTDLIVDGYDEYDLLHYYINAKYFDELGYFRLLPSLIVATEEAGPYCVGKAPIYLAQDENDYQIKPIWYALSKKDEIKSHFTDERWEQFKHDAMYIQRESRRLKCFLWRQLLQDHGFNGTPTWVLMARPITNMVPVESIKYATLIDLWLIIAMLGIVFWAFGGQAFAFLWIFITVSYSFRWPTITWCLLRYDWVTCMVMGIAFMKKKKPIAGGAFFGYATLMRYFPAIWLFGIAAKGIHALLTNKSVPWRRFWLRIPTVYYKMAAGFFGIILLLLTVSFSTDGIDAHKQSLKNMTAHVEPHNLSSMRQGLAIALTFRGETDQKLISTEQKEMVANMESTVRKVAIVFLIVLGLFMSRIKDWEAVGLGLIPYFFLTTSSYYYYSMRMTAVLIHAADLSKKRNVVGLIILFGIELFSHASEHLHPGYRYPLISIMGLMLLGYAVTMYGFLGVNWWQARKQEKALASGDGAALPDKSAASSESGAKDKAAAQSEAPKKAVKAGGKGASAPKGKKKTGKKKRK